MMPIPFRLRFLLVAVALASGCVVIEAPRRDVAPRVLAPCDYYAAPSPTGSASNNGLSTSTPFRPLDFWQLGQTAIRGKTLCLMDGIYQGNAYMIQPDHIAGTSTAIITIRALNDGAVFIDGQFSETPLWLDTLSWWTFQGFDVGNGVQNRSVATTTRLSHVTMQRMCISNTKAVVPSLNVHTLVVNGAADSLFEDLCIFGTGRNNINEYNDLSSPTMPSTNNVWRRVWTRWEGWPPGPTYQCSMGSGGSGIQLSYYQYGSGGGTIYENMIAINDPEQANQQGWPDYECGERQAGPYHRWAATLGAIKLNGWIVYGYDGFTAANRFDVDRPWFTNEYNTPGVGSGASVFQYRDIFVDARSQVGHAGAAPFSFACTNGAHPNETNCEQNSADRLTSIRLAATTPSSFTWANLTNQRECVAAGSPTTNLGGCADFYLGSGGTGPGARNCFEYTNGVLGAVTATQGLWPWRMDDRIKAALARARAAGTGGSALAGVTGSGYAAQTVTSEIAARYGPIPSQCLRTASGTTPNPPAGLTLTQLWQYIWTPLAGLRA